MAKKKKDQYFKLNGETLRLLNLTHERINGLIDGKNYDRDSYYIEAKRPVSTKEFNVEIDFKNRCFSGDTIQYGEWYRLDEATIRELLKAIEQLGQLQRPFNF